MITYQSLHICSLESSILILNISRRLQIRDRVQFIFVLNPENFNVMFKKKASKKKKKTPLIYMFDLSFRL